MLYKVFYELFWNVSTDYGLLSVVSYESYAFVDFVVFYLYGFFLFMNYFPWPPRVSLHFSPNYFSFSFHYQPLLFTIYLPLNSFQKIFSVIKICGYELLWEIFDKSYNDFYIFLVFSHWSKCPDWPILYNF